MKITIIGGGNIGGATANGFVRSGAVAPAELTVTARHESTLKKFAARGIRTSTDNCAAVKGAFPGGGSPPLPGGGDAESEATANFNLLNHYKSKFLLCQEGA